MQSTQYLLKTWFQDDEGINHHLSIETFLGVGYDLVYHCIIDGTKHLDVELNGGIWTDVENKDGLIAQKIGEIIEDYSE